MGLRKPQPEPSPPKSKAPSLSPKAQLQKAIAMLGTQQDLALACGLRQPTISASLARGYCSAIVAMRIERATHGRVLAQALCPYLFDR